RRDNDSSPDAGLWRESPIGAARPGIEGEYPAGTVRNENPAAGHGRLTIRVAAGIGKDPFHFKLRHVVRSEAGVALEPRIVEIDAPGRPITRVQFHRWRRLRAKIGVRIEMGRSGFVPGQECRDIVDLAGGEPRGLRHHRTMSQSIYD